MATGSQGTLLDAGGPVGEISDVGHSDTANSIDATNLSDGLMKYVSGTRDEEITFTLQHSAGALHSGQVLANALIQWADGVTTGFPGPALVDTVDRTGAVGDLITSNVTLKPARD